MIEKVNLLWKTVSEKLNDTSSPENAGNSMAPKSIVAISHDEKEELRKEGIKSPSKLLSPKYLSPASIKELKNSTGMEVDEVIKEQESKFETDDEVEEILKDEEDDEDGENFNARIRAGSLNNIKISCIVGQIFKKHAYIDLESPINIMSRRQYNQIMTYELKARQKPSNPKKISNFVRRVRGLNIFIGSFAYECDFMILEDTTSIINHHLGEMVFGRPFIDETGLVYNKERGTVMFEQNDEKITFKMPHTKEIFRQTKLMALSTDSIPPFAHEENFGHGRTHYYQSLLIGDEYKQDGGDRRGIRHLMRLEKEMMDNKVEVT
ncbi:protein kinase-like domain, concanavalin A-like lectin/glucanase domain protein [Tanacetum coccineum]